MFRMASRCRLAAREVALRIKYSMASGRVGRKSMETNRSYKGGIRSFSIITPSAQEGLSTIGRLDAVPRVGGLIDP